MKTCWILESNERKEETIIIIKLSVWKFFISLNCREHSYIYFYYTFVVFIIEFTAKSVNLFLIIYYILECPHHKYEKHEPGKLKTFSRPLYWLFFSSYIYIYIYLYIFFYIFLNTHVERILYFYIVVICLSLVFILLFFIFISFAVWKFSIIRI